MIKKNCNRYCGIGKDGIRAYLRDGEPVMVLREFLEAFSKKGNVCLTETLAKNEIPYYVEEQEHNGQRVTVVPLRYSSEIADAFKFDAVSRRLCQKEANAITRDLIASEPYYGEVHTSRPNCIEIRRDDENFITYFDEKKEITFALYKGDMYISVVDFEKKIGAKKLSNTIRSFFNLKVLPVYEDGRVGVLSRSFIKVSDLPKIADEMYRVKYRTPAKKFAAEICGKYTDMIKVLISENDSTETVKKEKKPVVKTPEIKTPAKINKKKDEVESLKQKIKEQESLIKFYKSGIYKMSLAGEDIELRKFVYEFADINESLILRKDEICKFIVDKYFKMDEFGRIRQTNPEIVKILNYNKTKTYDLNTNEFKVVFKYDVLVCSSGVSKLYSVLKDNF